MANRSYVSFLCEQDIDTLERWLDHALDERDAIIESGACDEELAEYNEHIRDLRTAILLKD